MWLSSILNSLSPSSPHARTRCRPSPPQRPAGRRLTLEALEVLPSLRFPEVIGFQKEEIHPTFIEPPR